MTLRGTADRSPAIVPTPPPRSQPAYALRPGWTARSIVCWTSTLPRSQRPRTRRSVPGGSRALLPDRGPAQAVVRRGAAARVRGSPTLPGPGGERRPVHRSGGRSRPGPGASTSHGRVQGTANAAPSRCGAQGAGGWTGGSGGRARSLEDAGELRALWRRANAACGVRPPCRSLVTEGSRPPLARTPPRRRQHCRPCGYCPLTPACRRRSRSRSGCCRCCCSTGEQYPCRRPARRRCWC